MAELPSKLILASCTGMALTGSFIGVSFGISYIALPGLFVPAAKANASHQQSSGSKLKPATDSDLLARQYQKMYDIGKIIGPILGVSSAASFIYAWRQLPGSAIVPRALFIAAAVFNLTSAPYTLTVMAGTNNELNRRANAAAAGLDETQGRRGAKAGSIESYNTPDLVEYWGTLNALRGVMFMGALACGMTALAI